MSPKSTRYATPVNTASNPITQFNAVISQIAELQSSVKPTYLAILTNKEIPLAERWEFFKKAPNNFKSNGCYTPHLSSLDNAETNLSWYDDFYVERHQTVDIVDIVERLESQDGEGDVFTYFESNPEAMDLLKEEILKQNLGTFEYDW